MTFDGFMSWMRKAGGVEVALLVTLAVAVADVLITGQVVLVGLLLAGPLLCGLTASPGATRALAGLAVALALASFEWNDSFGSWRYWVPLSVVVMGSAFSTVMASYRVRLLRDAERMRILADVAVAAREGQSVEEIAEALVVLLVPRFVDFCAIDMAGVGGSVRRLGEAVDLGPGGADPFGEGTLPGLELPDAIVVRGNELTSTLVAPLVVRDAPIGALRLATRSPRPPLEAGDDIAFVTTLAGRVALVLDNAELSQKLVEAERELAVILASVDAAVTVRDIQGRMVYANQAAADLLKLPDPDTVMAQAPGGLMGRFDVFTEAGDPVDLADLPGTQLLAGHPAPPPMTVRNVVRATGEERWLLNKATAITDADGATLMAVNLIEDITDMKRSEIAQRLLAETARTLAELSDVSKTLQAIADAAVPGLADWAGVDLLDPDGAIRPYAIAHRDPEKVRLGWRLRTGWPVGSGDAEGIPEVVRTGKPQLVHEITDEMLVLGAQSPEHLETLRALGLNSTMITPIQVADRVLGTLSFVSSTSRRFDDRDLQLASDLGRQAGVFIDGAQMYAEQRRVARTLQAGLIPEALPRIRGWMVSSAYRAAGRVNDVGGDFYDIVACGGGWAVVIGDVVGKGAEAAALTSLARHTLATVVESTGDLPEAFRILNRRLRQRGHDRPDLCTIAGLLIGPDEAVTLFSAGHPLPLYRRGGVVKEVGAAGPMLGFLDDVQVIPTRLDIRPGDQLLLYTDGVLDAKGSDGRFGMERLLRATQALADEAAANVAEGVLAAVDAFVDGEQNDDIAILSLVRSEADIDPRPIA